MFGPAVPHRPLGSRRSFVARPAPYIRRVHCNSGRRRSVRAAAFVLCLGLAATPAQAVGRALLHATLLRSTPAADARLAKTPDVIRLVFSEAVVAELSQIALTRPDGRLLQLPLNLDPRDTRYNLGVRYITLTHNILIGKVPPLSHGIYRVAWRVLSADGHPVAGNFSFSVESSLDSPSLVDSALFPPIVPPGIATSPANLDSVSQVGSRDRKPPPKTASLLRGLGLGAMMAGIGLLFFGAAAGQRRNLNPHSLVVRFLAVGALLLVAHMAAWLYHISPGIGLSVDFGASVFASTLGTVESARVVLALLSYWAIAFAGRRKLSLLFGAACLAVSGAVGHSAAIEPQWAIPAKIVHLLAGSVWIGGLLWLAWTFRRDITAFRIEARRVSSAALISLIAVFASGVVQTLLFLNSPWDLIRSDYGTLVLAKAAGLFLLTVLGAYNQFGLVPQLDDSRIGRRLSRSVTQELAIMTIVIVIGGFLAYVPTPN